jgi:uncharacterized protein YceH (UPF0502 family)
MSWYNPFSWDMVTNANVPTQYKDRDQLLGYVNQGMGPGGIANQTAAQIDPNRDAAFRNAQLTQLQQLQGVASGQQQGAGELAAQRQYANAIAAQQAGARMARGDNAALAYRNAANQSAALGSTAAGMGQQAALQDQQNAQGALTSAASWGRQGDFNTGNANAGYQQNTQNANAQNYLNLMNQLGNMNANELSAANSTAKDANTRQSNLLGGLLNQGGQAAAMMASDERLKKDITDGRSSIDDLLDKLGGPKEWTYKNQKRHGEGRWPGIIAQDMEKSDIGKTIVRDTPEGKMLDVNKSVSALLASAARLNERVRDLERK